MFLTALICFIFALIPFGLCAMNLLMIRTPRPWSDGGLPSVSVLIPARNEEKRIVPVLEAVLANPGRFELIVADDASTDRTAEIVRSFAARDKRVFLIDTPALASGWMGKNNACQALGDAARNDIGLFLDADVILRADAIERIAGFMASKNVGLASGFPHQDTVGFWEKVFIPFIHFVLIGFLPVLGMRMSKSPAFGAACGQLLAVRMSAYRMTGGHQAIKGYIHDGVQLSRWFRRQKIRTDLFDAEHLANTRMYENLRDLWSGFIKNAHEGMATPVGLPIWTALLFFGQVLPFFLLPICLVRDADVSTIALLGAAVFFAWGVRVLLAFRFRQSWLGVLIHPLGIIALLALQWTALLGRLRGKPLLWRGRSYLDDLKTPAP